MKKQEIITLSTILKSLITEEANKTLNEHFVHPSSTIGDILKDGKKRDPAWIWTSPKELNSPRWKKFKLASRFQPLCQDLSKYANENVVDFFGKKDYNRLEQIARMLQPQSGSSDQIEQVNYPRVFDEIIRIVLNAILNKYYSSL